MRDGATPGANSGHLANTRTGAGPRSVLGRGLSSLLWRGPGLIESQDEFVDLAGTCLGEASIGRDDPKAALLEDAMGRDVVGRDACVERAQPLDGQERVEGAGRDPLAPVGAADPVRDLTVVGPAPRRDRPGDLALDDDHSGNGGLVG